ncbi:elongation factor 4 [Candidatus Berkelbacteria bacterium CG_4_9_14_0_2_um_filter_42_30]|uniref:Elongation factor 4 n=6 Tax=Candidatus Berkelbacteria TaxID=1618330 RepID=A0A2M7K1P2_9BACT|nr:MAG: elongation factor 4 [Candidatus Berkelbacteria bacterium CG1_02_42_45]PIP50829.1 MAG: elongation factor 4 [Candidatus Berkelbacteria bacterium CG23_combo_of_CG06-09_8_20_14_all_41_73]PIX30160.1 MAG: elongation factor 4 [Candidatus Berkelbacteria bacterium CG_4_8_14_3_um_filter_42_13]PJC65797.1 MAG: elongation factor 4 [Candidatus Berkelbacteria bacterium CG_4_9_14_0_2_um_filter_42_30]
MAEKNLQSRIRNFCIISHVDHGKSTLADRMLELTDTIAKREMKEQVLDTMDLERERGITIKLAPVRMEWMLKNDEARIKNDEQSPNAQNSNFDIRHSDLDIKDSKYILNLIDTPGHVDFSYEVSRSLAAVEGVILLVDAAQGIEAQTLSTLYTALEHDLIIIPVVNKIDLPAARPEEVKEEIIKLLGCRPEEIIFASGKTGQGVEEILNAVIERIPPPSGDEEKPLQALIFDSVYDPYRGVVAYARVVNGKIESNSEIKLILTGSQGRAEEIGIFSPKLISHSPLSAGEIGYIVSGFKSVSEAAVGDTITLAKNPADSPLPGYQKVKPYVFASIFAAEGEKYADLKDAIEKLKLNDASLSYESERSEVLGSGFRCGFLGLLHLDIIRERFEREFDLDVIVTTPAVEYHLVKINGEKIIIERASQFPESHLYKEISEPWANLEIITPKKYIGGIMNTAQKKRAIYKNTEYFADGRAILKYEMPLAELIVDFYDQLKSVSKGYASMNYEILAWRPAELSKIDILIAEEKIDALSFIVYTPKAQSEARRIVERLKTLIPRQNFEVKIQAAIGGTIIASERISPLRKDVIAKLYGGDVTRKNKLLDKQKKGKKKMKQLGRVNVPSDIFIKVLKNE